MTQKIRLSQFVLTYGPGSILEARGSSRILPSAEAGLFGPLGLQPQEFEISDQRMSHGLLGGARIHRLPSNAELNVPEDHDLYTTRPFPEYLLCQRFRTHRSRYAVLFRGRDCPECGPGPGTGPRPAPVRFVLACSSGHLDDVDWPTLVHKRGTVCGKSPYLTWRAGGGSLGQIEVECPGCHAKNSMGSAYSVDWPCPGRFPERETMGHRDVPGCPARARIIQKQASNLRVAELRTLFTIPPRYTRLHNLLQLAPVFFGISAIRATQTPITRQVLAGVLHSLVAEQHAIPAPAADEILGAPWAEVEVAIADVFTPLPSDYEGLIHEEFEALARAAESGAPPVRGPHPTSPVVFRVDPNRKKSFECPSGSVLSVVPILTLRTVAVQLGYRREVDTREVSKVVDVSFVPAGTVGPHWFPGVEFLGEGIFITLDPQSGTGRRLTGPSVKTWFEARKSEYYPDQVFRSPRAKTELHPGFVWWHTLSHLLLRAAAIESGYSSTSIRERVYLDITRERIRGGVLLYAAQPGSDGTLGGLVALVPSFDRILEAAFQSLANCSSDPLCSEHTFSVGQYNGAACYACLMLSETSCEYRNMWLDRSVLLKNVP